MHGHGSVREVSLDSVIVRPEVEADILAVHEINCLAFESDGEATLVDRLREAEESSLSIVAEIDGVCVGHIFYSAVSVAGADSVLGLAPMAVTPALQKRGIGTLLVNHSLARLRAESWDGVVVLGHPDYYPRFGFRPAAEYDLKCSFDVPDGVFMALELKKNGLEDARGLVEYHPLFNSF